MGVPSPVLSISDFHWLQAPAQTPASATGARPEVPPGKILEAFDREN